MPVQELKFFWHIHHRILCEASYNIQERIDYIKANKDLAEIPIRLKLLTPILHTERLPLKWKEADAKREEADAKREEADANWRKADAKRKEAYAKWGETDAKWGETDAKWGETDAKWGETDAKLLPELEALHKEEHPNCPWNGETIFPEVS